MSLANRLRTIEKRVYPVGCQTCKWLSSRTEDERSSIREWLQNGYPMRQLYSILVSEPDPLPISLTAFKNHLRDCERLI